MQERTQFPRMAREEEVSMALGAGREARANVSGSDLIDNDESIPASTQVRDGAPSSAHLGS